MAQTIFSGEKIFRWNTKRSWSPIFRRTLKPILGPEVIAQFCRIPDRHKQRSLLREDATLDWLDDLITEVRGQPFEESKNHIANLTRNSFGYVTGFHACRPRSIEDYTKHGLRASSRDFLTQQAFQIFGSTPEIERAVQDQWAYFDRLDWNRLKEGKLWMFLNFAEGIDNCPQYARAGSEWMRNLGKVIGRKDELTQNGTPTIIECAVPLRQLDWTSVATTAVCELLRGSARLKPFPDQQLCLSIRGNIPPENIIAIHDVSEQLSNSTRRDAFS